MRLISNAVKFRWLKQFGPISYEHESSTLKINELVYELFPRIFQIRFMPCETSRWFICSTKGLIHRSIFRMSELQECEKNRPLFAWELTTLGCNSENSSINLEQIYWSTQGCSNGSNLLADRFRLVCTLKPCAHNNIWVLKDFQYCIHRLMVISTIETPCTSCNWH